MPESPEPAQTHAGPSGTRENSRTPEPSRPVEPAGKPAVNPSLRKLTHEISGPSIKSVMEGKSVGDSPVSAKEQHALFTQVVEDEAFTEVSVLVKWTEFLETLNDRPNLKSAMNRKPQINANGTLLLKVDNIVQDELIKTNKPQLVAWLRRELKNSSIDISTEIQELPANRVAYTDGEKFEEMLKKNATLALLKQRFHLDFGE